MQNLLHPHKPLRIHQCRSGVEMPHPQPRPNRQRPCLISTPRRRSSSQQQVRHLRHRRNHNNRLQPQPPPPTNDSSRPLHGRRIFNRSASKLHHNEFFAHHTQTVTARWCLLSAFVATVSEGTPSLSNLPIRASTSAFSTAAPAAPRIVLCDNTTNFQSSRLHGRSRPTVAAIPFPRILSSRGCGRSTLASYSTGWSGAVGRCCPRSGANSLQAASTSSRVAFFINLILTHSVCPSSTATRLQCALTFASSISTPSPATRPSSFPTSSCSFSSSFLMNGTTFPRMSNEATPGYPAPLTACIVETNRLSIPNRSSSGFSASTSPIAQQFGLVTINPPESFRQLCPSIIARWSAFTSGTTRGTSAVMRNALEFEITAHPAAANFGSSSRAISA